MPKAYITEECRETPVRETCDVLVVGGGTAGCVAALAAARSGAETILIEQLPMVSGTMGNGGMIANSFYSSYTGPEVETKRVVAGIPQEIFDRLIEVGGCPGYAKVDETKNKYYRPYVVIQNREIYAGVISEMLIEAGVKVYLHTFLADVLVKDNCINGVIIESKSGREAIKAKVFVDCTGDGDLAAAAGADHFSMHNAYPFAGNTSLFFGVGNVDLVKFFHYSKDNDMISEEIALHDNKDSEADNIIRFAVNLKKCDRLPPEAILYGVGRMVIESVNQDTVSYLSVMGKPNVDATNVAELTNAEMELRIRALEVGKCLRKYMPGFEKSYINWTSNQLGIRVTRIIKCEYSITPDDVIYSGRFEDEIGMFGYQDLSPIGPEYVMKNKGYYGLPYRMILPQKLKNVLVAGRMVSETFAAHMSTRNTMCCMVQGQAAGTAAALSVQKGVLPKELDYRALREKLIGDGVYIEPQAY